MNLINMITKILVWKFEVRHFSYMHVAMVTVTVVWTSESIWFITCRCSSYECLRCEVFRKNVIKHEKDIQVVHEFLDTASCMCPSVWIILLGFVMVDYHFNEGCVCCITRLSVLANHDIKYLISLEFWKVDCRRGAWDLLYTVLLLHLAFDSNKTSVSK